jgi:hypothetical protein
LAAGGAEELSAALRAGCASFFGEDKRVFYEASKFLMLAKQEFQLDQRPATKVAVGPGPAGPVPASNAQLALQLFGKWAGLASGRGQGERHICVTR